MLIIGSSEQQKGWTPVCQVGKLKYPRRNVQVWPFWTGMGQSPRGIHGSQSPLHSAEFNSTALQTRWKHHSSNHVEPLKRLAKETGNQVGLFFGISRFLVYSLIICSVLLIACHRAPFYHIASVFLIPWLKWPDATTESRTCHNKALYVQKLCAEEQPLQLDRK